MADLTLSADIDGFLQAADKAAARTALDLGTLATQSGTFSGTSSGTNTGDQDLSGLVATSQLSTTATNNSVAQRGALGQIAATTISATGGTSSFSSAAVSGTLTAGSISLNGVSRDSWLYTPTTDSSTARTLALADAVRYLRFTNVGAITLTVPTNASVAFPVGTVIPIRRATGAGAITLSITGVTVNGSAGAPSVAAGANFALQKIATDEWDFI